MVERARIVGHPELRLSTTRSPFEEKIGDSRAVVDGGPVFVSGCTGFDHSTMRLANGVVG